MKSRICLGVIGKSFGVNGSFNVKTYTNEPQDILQYGSLSDKDSKHQFDLKLVRAKEQGIIAKVDWISSREDAARYTGTELYTFRDKLPKLDDEQYYHADLKGLNIEDEHQQIVGKVVDVYNYGAGDILEIKKKNGSNIMLPFKKEIFISVNLEQKVITASSIEEIFDDD